MPHLVAASGLAAYLRDEETGDFHLLRSRRAGDRPTRPTGRPVAVVPVGRRHGVPRERVRAVRHLARRRGDQCRDEFWLFGEVREVLVAPLHWEPDGFGALVLGAKEVDARFTEQDLRLARGIADITSLALGNARRLSELERFHELVASLDAVFWEADAASLRLSFIGGRAEQLLGANEQEWIAEGRRWGDHTLARGSRRRDHGRPDRRRRRPGPEPGVPGVRRPTAARSGSATWCTWCAALKGPRQLRGPDDRHHGAQARRAGAATERTEVLGGVPSGTRSSATTPRARRDEEHVPRGGLARPADTPDLDPGLRAHARADRAQAAEGRRARPRRPDRGERPEARTVAVGPARPRPAAARASSARNADRPIWRSSCTEASTEPRTPPTATSRWRSNRSRCPSTRRRSNGSWRTCCRTRSATRRTAPGSGSAVSVRTAV